MIVETSRLSHSLRQSAKRRQSASLMRRQPLTDRKILGINLWQGLSGPWGHGAVVIVNYKIKRLIANRSRGLPPFSTKYLYLQCI
jgi:hypothetical protein